MWEIHRFPLLVNGIGEDVGGTVMTGKVIRPIRSVDPSQTEYQGLIELLEEGLSACDSSFKVHHFIWRK